MSIVSVSVSVNAGSIISVSVIVSVTEISLAQLNSTHSLMRKDLTGPNGHLHMPIIKLKKDKQIKHVKFMVTLPHGRQQHYLAVF